MIKHQQEGVNFESNNFKNYKRKVNKVTNKIKKWHEEIQLGHNEFQNDADFIQDIESPCHFSDYSLEDEDENSSQTIIINKNSKATLGRHKKLSGSA
jgi:alcohol dehydrogenase YqhD (iron-dependent ADH family)